MAHGLNVERISRETRTRFSYETVSRLLHEEHRRAVKVSPGHEIPEAVGSQVVTDEVH